MSNEPMSAEERDAAERGVRALQTILQLPDDHPRENAIVSGAAVSGIPARQLEELLDFLHTKV